MFQSSLSKSCAMCVVLSCACSIGEAVTLVPEWAGGALSTDASYTFTTNSRTAAPEVFHNPYGSPSLLIEDETLFGTGWQDPEGENQSIRVPGEGGWDLGQYGKMSVTVPICPPADFSAKNLEVFVNLVWYQGSASVPSMTIGGQVPTTSAFESELVQLDGAGSWRRTVWSATFDGYEPDTLTLVLTAPWNGSVIDSVSIYTLVPEPGSVLLILFGASVLVVRRKRTF